MEKNAGGSFLIETADPEDIFTPEDMTEEHKLVAKAAEEFLLGEVAPVIDDLEAKKEGLMLQLLKKSAEVGLMGGDIPEEYGGMGLDKISSLIITEKVPLGGPFAVANVDHTGIGSLPIVYFGNDEQKRRYLPGLANGELIGAYALTEPEAGTDALNAKTTAVLSEDGKYYILNGEKQFITNAAYADIFITYAKIDGEQFTGFIIDRNSEGLSLGEEEDKMGIRGTSTRSLILENVKVPVENLLFKPGKGHVVAFNILNIGRYKLGGACVGAAKLALADTIQYAKSRVQFGRPIAEFGLIREKIAEMVIRTFVAESMVYRNAGLIEDRLKGIDMTSPEAGYESARGIEEYATECSINKVYGSEMLDYVVDEAVQIHGGYGYIKDYPVERYYRDSRINRIFEGTNEINRLLILRMLLRRAIKGQLPLIQAMKQAASDLLRPSGLRQTPQEGMAMLLYLLENAKKIALLTAGAVYQAHPDDLEQQQELLGMISDIIIECFAMDSSLLRVQKMMSRGDGISTEIPQAIVSIYTVEAMMRVERWAKLIFAAVAKGDVFRTQLSALKRLTRYLPVDAVNLRRKVADRVLHVGRYLVT